MQKTKKFLLFLTDVFLLYGALFLALFIRYGANEAMHQFSYHALPFSGIFIIWLSVFYLSDFYKYIAVTTHFELLKKLVQGVVLASIISIILFYLFPLFFTLTPKTNLFLFSGVFFLLSYLVRTAIFHAFASNRLPTALIGNSATIHEIADYLSSRPHAGYRILQQVSDITPETLSRLLTKEFESCEVFVIDGSLMHHESSIDIAYRLTTNKKVVMGAGEFYEQLFERISLETLSAEWFLKNVSPKRPFYDVSKRIFDLVLSVILFLVLLPLFLLIALLVKLTSRGPVFFTQERIGLDNVPFILIKFRTMSVDAEKDGPRFSEKHDPRVTPIGKILRFTHLDEIPQLINITKGELSFVGPRPERGVFVETFKKTIPYFETRNSITPGLTGWAQVNYRYTGNTEETRTKLSYDIFYLKNRSLILDAIILFRTIKTILFTPGT